MMRRVKLRCTGCAWSFEADEARCPRCLRATTVVEDVDEPSPRRPGPPKALVVGVAIWASGFFALQALASRGATVSDRWERGALGGITFVGFVTAVFGAIAWRRDRRG